MGVVAVIGLLAAIAVPSFTKARSTARQKYDSDDVYLLME